MSKYYIVLILITLFSAAILLVSDTMKLTNIGTIGWLALLFFVSLTLLLNKLSLNAEKKNNSRFVSGMMGVTGLRMLFCIIFIFSYWLMSSQRDPYFVGYFFILYLFYTMFEILFLVSKLRADKKDGIISKTN